MENEVNPIREEQFTDGTNSYTKNFGAGVNKETGIKEILFHSKKITEALYRVTELFPNKEPLKWILRNESVKILELIVSLEISSPEKKILYFDKISGIINKIIHLLDIAALNSYIANINLGVIKREYEKIDNFILNNRSLYFEIPEISALKIDAFPANLIGQDNGQINNGANSSMSVMSDIDIKQKENAGSEITYKINNGKEFNKTGENTNRSEFSERAKKILSVINAKEARAMAINEVFKHFNNISKKTVQRELGKLVQNGFLKMEGEKRWRIYSIK